MVVTWILIPTCLAMAIVFTTLANWALREPEDPPEPPCSHPWYIDHRCIVCGQPK